VVARIFQGNQNYHTQLPIPFCRNYSYNAQGCANKNNHLGKIIILVTVADFSTKLAAFTEEDSGNIYSKFHYNICYHLTITTNET